MNRLTEYAVTNGRKSLAKAKRFAKKQPKKIRMLIGAGFVLLGVAFAYMLVKRRGVMR